MQCNVIVVTAQSVSSFGLTSNVAIRPQKTQLSMKLFDWKKRDAFEKLTIPDGILDLF